MKLRNKKTGEVGKLHCDMNVIPTKYGVFEDTDIRGHYWEYDSLAELNEDWEDYKPAEPLIKDEKIRKVVRAWAEMNDIRFIRMCSRTRKENARIVGQNALGRTFTMEIDNEYEIRVCFKDYKECYTIAELCGEEA